MGHPFVMLSTIVATISVLPASIAYLGRRSLPPFVTYALTHAAISGFAVALAASPPLAAMTTGMLGKVTSAPACTRSAQIMHRSWGTARVRRSGWLALQRPTGEISALGIVTWWPYHLGLRTKLSVQRRITAEPAWNQILPGWCAAKQGDHGLLTDALTSYQAGRQRRLNVVRQCGIEGR